MANIAITSHCNLNCSYCFAQATFSDPEKTYGHMTPDVFKKSLDILQKSNIGQVSILGGEPTLHPDFMQYMEMAFQAGLTVKLFTNGYLRKEDLNYLCGVPEEKIIIILNINDPPPDYNKIPPPVKNTIIQLNKKILPGYNIYNKRFSLYPILGIIKTFGLKKKIRLGLAQPCLGYKNEYLPIKHYAFVGHKILEFAQKAQEQSVKIILDCGFVPCMFGISDLRQFGFGKETGFHCDPIPDILPDGSIVPCYPLSGLYQDHINNIDNIIALRKKMKKSQVELSHAGIFKTCSVCAYKKENHCTGGCMAHKIRRFNRIYKVTESI